VIRQSKSNAFVLHVVATSTSAAAAAAAALVALFDHNDFWFLWFVFCFGFVCFFVFFLFSFWLCFGFVVSEGLNTYAIVKTLLVDECAPIYLTLKLGCQPDLGLLGNSFIHYYSPLY